MVQKFNLLILLKYVLGRNKEEKVKSIIGLSLSDSQLHLIDLDKSSAEIWEHLSKIFGEKVVNEKFSLKLQSFKLKNA